jgi:nucleoside-diphosphate-sugar epimerase
MVAITGANGLVGSFIANRFVEAELPVTAITRTSSDTGLLDGSREKMVHRHADVLDMQGLTDAIAGADTVIHTAAMVSFDPRRTKRILSVNVEGTRNVVNTCLSQGIRRLIHISSVSALGRPKGISEIDEESQWIPNSVQSAYAESKYLAELEVYRGSEEGLDVALVNPSVVLAPGNWEKSSAQLFRYAWDERPFYTSGSLNYVDVRDLAEMVFRINGRSLKGEKFIASAGVISIKDFLGEVASRFNKKPPSIEVSSSWIGIAAGLERIRSTFTGREPLVTKQTVRMLKETCYYSSQKANQVLGLHFHPLAETLDWCCGHYLRKVTINK